MAVTPNSGSGNAGLFTFPTYQEQPGFEAVGTNGWVQFLIAASTTGGNKEFCFVHYDRGGNAFWMYDWVAHLRRTRNAGSPSAGLNSAGCFLDTSTATVNDTGGTLTLTLPITLKFGAADAGPMFLFQRMMDELRQDTGWIQTGTWTVP